MPPADRVVVDWRISEYELVDDNEASYVDKPVVLEGKKACFKIHHSTISSDNVLTIDNCQHTKDILLTVTSLHDFCIKTCTD